MAKTLKTALVALTFATAAMTAGATLAQTRGSGFHGGAGRIGGGFRGSGFHGGGFRGPGFGYRYRGYRGGYPGSYWGGYYAPWFWGFGLAPYYDYYDEPYGPPLAYYDAPPPPPPERRVSRPAPAVSPQSFIVYFPFDKADLTGDARDVIRSAASYAHDRGGHIVIVGHTDTSGSVEYNQALSERRARAVREALGGEGVNTTSVEMDWKGKRDTAVDTGDGVKEPRNRRVTILVQPNSGREADAGDDQDMR